MWKWKCNARSKIAALKARGARLIESGHAIVVLSDSSRCVFNDLSTQPRDGGSTSPLIFPMREREKRASGVYIRALPSSGRLYAIWGRRIRSAVLRNEFSSEIVDCTLKNLIITETIILLFVIHYCCIFYYLFIKKNYRLHCWRWRWKLSWNGFFLICFSKRTQTAL